MTHNRFWWNCKYLETDRNLGVAFCSKTNDFCNKSKCDKIKLKSQKHNQFYRERIKELEKENEKLKQQLKDMSRFEHTDEHIRLSINIETGKLQRHIYATGQWFGDFDRVLCENWISKEDYQRFIDRVIEVYNTEFKGDVE